MKRYLILIFCLALTNVSVAKDIEITKHYGNGIAELNIDYPASFIMDPRSHKGEAIWWSKFDDPNSELSIEVNSFGYVSGWVREQGYKTPEEYIVKYEVGKDPKKTEHQGYYRFISMILEEVRVTYLEKNADWGRCFQSLLFTFPKGEYPKHKNVIDKIIESAVPSFAIVSEQDSPLDQYSPAAHTGK